MRGCYVLLAGLLLAASAKADEVRFFEKDGITYRETRQVVSRPVIETTYEQREQTFYREQYKTELQQSTRLVQTPITEYRTMACLHGRWNPFIQPYYTYQTVPVRRFETRQEVVQVPVTRRELVPEQRTVQIPVTTQRIAQEEVITRVAISAAPSGAANLVAQGGTAIGGVARLESSTPRVAANARSTFTPAAPLTPSAQVPLTAQRPSVLQPAPVAARPAPTVLTPATPTTPAASTPASAVPNRYATPPSPVSGGRY